MIEVKVIKPSKVYMLNKEHQNFTERDGEQIIDVGTILKGREIFVNGLRRSQPFTYRMFRTIDGKYIYNDNVEPLMNTTEVILNADGQKIVVGDTTQTKTIKIASAIGLGLIGFEYARRKNVSLQSKIIYTAIGLGIGYYLGGKLSKNNLNTK